MMLREQIPIPEKHGEYDKVQFFSLKNPYLSHHQCNIAILKKAGGDNKFQLDKGKSQTSGHRKIPLIIVITSLWISLKTGEREVVFKD